MVITVTSEDCLRGVRASAHHCAYARAIKRALPGCFVAVANGVVRVRDEVDFVDIDLSASETERIERYDAGEPMQPHELTLAVPERFLRNSHAISSGIGGRPADRLFCGQPELAARAHSFRPLRFRLRRKETAPRPLYVAWRVQV